MKEPFRVFIGWDSRFPEAAQVLAYSLRLHSSVPVDIRYLDLWHLERCYQFSRSPDPAASTEFTYSRFLVPYLCGYQGTALFMDNDMLCVCDPAPLFETPLGGYALRVVQHDHRPTETLKMGGVPQSVYPRKNWSSLMLMDCSRLTVWTKEAVESQSGAWLHRFAPLPDHLIGPLPEHYNTLVSEDLIQPQSHTILHWTSGGPWNTRERTWPHEDLWLAYRDQWAGLGDGIPKALPFLGDPGRALYRTPGG